MNFDAHSRCPICHKEFKSDNCPHSIWQVEEFLKDKKLADKIKKEVNKMLKSR